MIGKVLTRVHPFMSYAIAAFLMLPACVNLTPPWATSSGTGGSQDTGGSESAGGSQVVVGSGGAGGALDSAGGATGGGGAPGGGGAFDSGGAIGGGAMASSGGTTGFGGSPASSGGASGRGGSTSGSGGSANRSGGSAARSGGTVAHGGSAARSGGAIAHGGSMSSGGASSNGGGASGNGGSTGSGGAALDAGTLDSGAQLVNLSLGKPVTSVSQQKGKEATRGNDGSPTTSFCPNSGALPVWWRVDLGAVYLLAQTDVDFEKPNSYYKYKIDVSSDDTTWTTVVDQTTNTTRNGVTLTDTLGVAARYVRVTITGISTVDWGCFWEFTVWG